MNDSVGIVRAAQDNSRVSGLTHTFYKYPARFSPNFVKAIIDEFSAPGDLVLDPFCGGGTTLVEAVARGRRCAGIDINSLAIFVSKVKTNFLSKKSLLSVQNWLNENNSGNGSIPCTNSFWHQEGYLRNLNGHESWRIRNVMNFYLERIDLAGSKACQNFARCVLLKTAQWAFEGRKKIPPIAAFRKQMMIFFQQMSEGMHNLVNTTRQTTLRKPEVTCLHRSAVGVELDPRIRRIGIPKIILTSPPYPGVHILYHRWQVNGRKETPAPYWISAQMDGSPSSYYNFGSRHQPGLTRFFEVSKSAFASLAHISDRNTTLVQMVAFAEPDWQLPLYLKALAEAGWTETAYLPATANDNRIWRDVPNRKWHAAQKGEIAASKEVVLFHKLSRGS